MAHIRRHPVDPSKWQVRYIDPTGRERSRTFRRRVDADKFLIQIEAQKQQGLWVNPDKSATRLEDWAQQWITTRVNLKPKTMASYQSLLAVHVLPRFGTVPLDRIQRIQIEAWVADLSSKLSPSRTRQAHQVLNALLDSAVQARFLAANPAHRVALPRARQREQLFLTPEQVLRLSEATPEPFRALVLVMAYGGLRWGEAVALRTKRIDVLRGEIRVAEAMAEISGALHFGSTKNYKARTGFRSSFARFSTTRSSPSPARDLTASYSTSPTVHHSATRTSAKRFGSRRSKPPAAQGVTNARPSSHGRGTHDQHRRPSRSHQTPARPLLDQGDYGRLWAPLPI